MASKRIEAIGKNATKIDLSRQKLSAEDVAELARRMPATCERLDLDGKRSS